MPTSYGLLRAGSWPMGLGRRRLPEYDEAAPVHDAGGEADGKVRLDFEHGARDIDRLSMRYGGQPYKYPPTDSPQKRVSLRLRPTGFSGMGMK